MGKNRPIEPNGTVFVVSSQNKYVIEGLLGRGGFGDVYKVCLQRDRTKKYAMKTERVGIPAMCERLKIECVVFEKLRTTKGNRQHFVHMADAGLTDNNKFLVMELVSYSLAEIFYRMCKREFTIHTVIQIARQTLTAIEALHEMAWLHRDVKPGNFSIGYPPNDSIIYMLDFGIAREFRDYQGRLRVPRVSVTTPKTLRYCSLRAHNNQEQSRRDDMEAWLYMILEFFEERNISWKTTKTFAQIFWRKMQLLNEPVKLYNENKLCVPVQFIHVIQAIDRMKYVDPPEYTRIREILDIVVKEEEVDMTLPLDWIAKSMPEKPKIAEVPMELPKDDKKKEKDSADKAATNEEEREAARNVKIAKKLARGFEERGIRLTPAQLKNEVEEWKEFKADRLREEQEYREGRKNSDSSQSTDSKSNEERSSYRRRDRTRKYGSKSTKSVSRTDAKDSRDISAKHQTKIGLNCAEPNELTCKSNKSEMKFEKNGKIELKSAIPEETCKSTTNKSLMENSKVESTCKSTTSKQEKETEKTAKSGLFSTIISKIRRACDRKPEELEMTAPEAQKK